MATHNKTVMISIVASNITNIKKIIWKNRKNNLRMPFTAIAKAIQSIY